jgi:hypothetical protein
VVCGPVEVGAICCLQATRSDHVITLPDWAPGQRTSQVASSDSQQSRRDMDRRGDTAAGRPQQQQPLPPPPAATAASYSGAGHGSKTSSSDGALRQPTAPQWREGDADVDKIPSGSGHSSQGQLPAAPAANAGSRGSSGGSALASGALAQPSSQDGARKGSERGEGRSVDGATMAVAVLVVVLGLMLIGGLIHTGVVAYRRRRVWS